MDTPDLTVYRELADHYERLGQSSMRDRFLMLAADAAFQAKQPDEAERLRQRLLAGNRHHMLRPYSSFEEAARAADVQAYLEGLRTNYPPDQARDLLNSLRGDDAAAVPPTMPPSSPPTLPPAPAPQPTSARGIPMTAPLIDVNARAPRPLDQSRPFEPMQVDATPQRSPRPRAQPAPAPAPPAPGQKKEPAGPMREIPLDETPAPQRREPPPPRPAPPPRRPANLPPEIQPGAWLNATLAVVAVAVGLAAMAFALARPFVPSGWLSW